MSADEIRKLKDEEINLDEFEFVYEDPYLAKSQKVRDILDALDLVDPITKKIENTLPSGDLPGQEFTNIEYFTVYEPTISGSNRKKLIEKLLSYLLEDDDTVQ